MNLKKSVYSYVCLQAESVQWSKERNEHISAVESELLNVEEFVWNVNVEETCIPSPPPSLFIFNFFCQLLLLTLYAPLPKGKSSLQLKAIHFNFGPLRIVCCGQNGST